MTDEPQITPPPEPETPPAVVESEGQTVEEVEAFWKNRVSAEAKAHAAEAKTLRDQLAAEKAARTTEAERLEASRRAEMTDVERAQQEAADAKRELAEERAARAVETLKAKYPDAAEALDDAVLVSMPAEKLEALQNRLAGEPAPDRMETNGAARSQARKEPEDPLSDEAYRRMAEEAFPDSYHPK